MYDSDDIRDKPSHVSRALSATSALFQHYLDSLAPHLMIRWSAAITFVLLFLLRVIIIQGFYIVTYFLFLHLLALFLMFLTPLVDPSLECEDEEDDGPTLPTKNASNDDEFRPFMRRLPEFKFWIATMKATGLAFLTTFIDILDVPVFWPILVLYFIILTVFTLKRQIQHMIKYRYIPFNIGKPQRKANEFRVNHLWKM